MVSDAIAAAQGGNWSGCLATLLAAWRPQRPPELAAMIVRVGRRLPRSRVPPRVEVATSADVTAILARIEGELDTMPQLQDQAIALSERVGPDPRIATFLAARFERSPYKRTDGRLDIRVLAALDAIDDPRYRELIVRAADAYPVHVRAKPAKLARIELLVATAGRVRARPAPPALTMSLAALEVELARGPRIDPEPLLAAIYEDPASTAARLVYADALQDIGDPRGEFIAMQCAPRRSAKRERQLLRQHQKEWLGPLAPCVREVVFERGFPAIAYLGSNRFALAPLDREWQTLEQIDTEKSFGEALTRLLAGIQSLRRVARFNSPDLGFLTEPVPWTSFGVKYPGYAFATTFTTRRHHLFPALEELDLSAVSQPHLNGLGSLESLRVRIVARTREHVDHFLDRKAGAIVLVPEYSLQLRSHVTIAEGVATSNDPQFFDSLKSIIPRTIKTSGTRPASTDRPAP